MERAYPVLQIGDYEGATRYYVDFLGFNITFEYRHEEGFPVYMGVSRGDLDLHLTEHKGDVAGPGAAYLQISNVREYYEELKAKRSDLTAPTDQPWGSTELHLVDPYDNRLTFASSTE